MTKRTSSRTPGRYPVPGPVGGALIRKVIGFLRAQSVSLPLEPPAGQKIAIAFSGGSDSTALARLIVKYGRRIVKPEQLVLVHINHGWRPDASKKDEAFARNSARHWGVPIQVVRLKGTPDKGRSWEEEGRLARKAVFKQYPLLLTAHQADDLAETAIWRMMTGASETHGGGIRVLHENELRPLLQIRKSMLVEFLREEGIGWREDQTNYEGRFLRSKMRRELMPVVEKLFPRAVEHLIDAALKCQQKESERAALEPRVIGELFAATGQRSRRPHLSMIASLSADPNWRGEIHLPGGWKLSRSTAGRWVLENAIMDEKLGAKI